MNLIVIIILLVNIHLSKSFTFYGSSNSFRKLTCLRASSVDSYISEAREILPSDIKDVELIMKVALLLSIKDKEKEKELIVKDKEKEKELIVKDNEKATALMQMQMQKEKDIKENYYLKKLSILSLRYDHIIIIIE